MRMDIDADRFFRLLGDPTRLRAVSLLVDEGELCVCELTGALGEIQPKVSRHLALLRDDGLVLDRRQGQWIYYRINPQLPRWVKTVINETIRGNRRRSPFREDRNALRGMTDRPRRWLTPDAWNSAQT